MPAKPARQESTLKKEKKPVKLRVWLRWKSAVRPFKKRDREFYTTVGAIVILLAVILFFLKEWLLIAAMIALTFVAYVLATVEPEKVEHKITSRGVVTGEKRYEYKDLVRFWFSRQWQDEILNIETKLNFPGRLMMLLGEESKKKVRKLLEREIKYEKPEETFLDRSAKWLSEKVPLEKE